jgi:DNA repair photolyase
VKTKSDDTQTTLLLEDQESRPLTVTHAPVDYWHAPATITENNFIHKSLSNWAFNVAVGCSHACRFCYVPDAATIKQGPQLADYGVKDPDAEWGDYVLLRPWNEQNFLASLRAAENTPRSNLKADGNRAIMYCSTTDPYQVIRHPDPARQTELLHHSRFVVRRSLELILARSTLNVRVLTRSPLAKTDFDLFHAFGKRLTFGMSLPTLRDALSRLYEPRAPGPRQRLAALREASQAGLHVFVAMAPTYPECDAADLEATLQAVAELNPITVFHEPINIRANNVRRIQARADETGARLNAEVFTSRQNWQRYAMEALMTVKRIAQKVGLGDRLHSWPDKSLGTLTAATALGQPGPHMEFIYDSWNRISEWPR